MADRRQNLQHARIFFFFFLRQNFNTRAFCAAVWVSHVRRPVFVKRKSPIQSLVCVCGRGGALFHTQPVGNSSPPLVVAQFAYPAILHSPLFFFSPSRRLRSRTESAGSSKLKRESVKNSAPSRRQPPGAQQPTRRFGTEQGRLCCVWRLLKCSAAFQ